MSRQRWVTSGTHISYPKDSPLLGSQLGAVIWPESSLLSGMVSSVGAEIIVLDVRGQFLGELKEIGVNKLMEVTQPLEIGALSASVSVPQWRDAVIYQIYPRSFVDSNDDGIGDIEGLIRGLPYLSSLGVDTLWITPFFTSPMHDGGYDVSDYRDVDPIFGTLGDAEHFIRCCHDHGLRIVLDLVANHCSKEHPWFQMALASGEDSAERDRFFFFDGRVEGAALPPPPTGLAPSVGQHGLVPSTLMARRGSGTCTCLTPRNLI